MAVYVLRVPHQRPPVAFVCAEPDHALWLLSEEYERDFEDLDEAVSHDMHAGFWATSKADLIERARQIPHQMLKSIAAVEALP